MSSKKKSEFIKKRNLPNGGYQYLINIKLINKKYKLNNDIIEDVSDTEKPNESKISLIEKKQENKEIEILKKYVDSLESQLAVKDKQIFELLAQDRENHILLEKINEALIKYRVPEYIETQVIPNDKVTSSVQENSSQGNKEEDIPKKETLSANGGSFSDWLKNL